MKRHPWIFFFFVPSSVCFGWQLTLPPGGTITIPCHYDLKYIQHKKYWCYDAGAAYNYCKILAYANNTEDKVTVTDYPAQSVFTVTMRDLQSEDTGSYWCAVEIEGILSRDVDEQMFITVKADPDLSVKESSVSGQEGGSVSVQCLYSAGYHKEQKQWCRSKDGSCYTVGRTNTAQGSAVQISDDGRRSFRVEMSELQKSDAGWYWCKTGKLQIPVHLSVSESHSAQRIVAGCLAVLLLLMLLPAVATWLLRKRQATTEGSQVKVSEEDPGCERHTTDPELSYSSVLFKQDEQKKSSPETQNSSASEDPVIYSTLTDT